MEQLGKAGRFFLMEHKENTLYVSGKGVVHGLAELCTCLIICSRIALVSRVSETVYHALDAVTPSRRIQLPSVTCRHTKKPHTGA